MSSAFDLAVTACQAAKQDMLDSDQRLMRKIAAGLALAALPRQQGRRTSSDHPTTFQAACLIAGVHRDTAYRWIELSKVERYVRLAYFDRCQHDGVEATDAGLLRLAAVPEGEPARLREDHPDARRANLKHWLSSLASTLGTTTKEETIYEIARAAYAADLKSRGVQ